LTVRTRSPTSSEFHSQISTPTDVQGASQTVRTRSPSTCYPNHCSRRYTAGGKRSILASHAFGSQGYFCLHKDGSVSWTVNGARPEATLFATFFGEPVQIITHFLSHDDDPTPQARQPSATPLGRARSIAARCGPLQVPQRRSRPAPTQVARMLARLLASYERQSGQKKGQLAAKYWPKPPSSNA
jgi:hypothetical protein